jgi:siroheme synthase-like protein
VNLFPAFLRLDGRDVLLVGGGAVAAGKLSALLAAGARVTVVAPEIRAGLDQPGVRLVKRAFTASDLDGKWFVIAAAPAAVNREVAGAAEERRVFVNAADDRASASAFLGGVVRKGGITLAISTGGRAPALAALLRQSLDRILPDEVGSWLELAERARTGPLADRRPLLFRALEEIYR